MNAKWKKYFTVVATVIGGFGTFACVIYPFMGDPNPLPVWLIGCQLVFWGFLFVEGFRSLKEYVKGPVDSFFANVVAVIGAPFGLLLLVDVTIAGFVIVLLSFGSLPPWWAWDFFRK